MTNLMDSLAWIGICSKLTHQFKPSLRTHLLNKVRSHMIWNLFLYTETNWLTELNWKKPEKLKKVTRFNYTNMRNTSSYILLFDWALVLPVAVAVTGLRLTSRFPSVGGEGSPCARGRVLMSVHRRPARPYIGYSSVYVWARGVC